MIRKWEGETINKLIPYLDKHKIQYEVIKHKKQINTAKEGADYLGIDIGQTAPTLILKTEQGYYALIISGDYDRVNLQGLRELLKARQVKLAKPSEVEQITGYKVGSIPIINLGLPTILDRQLNRYTYVYGGTGTLQSTLKIKPIDIEKLNKIIGYLRWNYKTYTD